LQASSVRPSRLGEREIAQRTPGLGVRRVSSV
jgi:hypothetical protein